MIEAPDALFGSLAKVAKAAGHMVCTNTTVFQETQMTELDELFAYLTTLGVDGFIISPAYSYAAVNSKEIFMTRDDIKAKFRAAEAMFGKYKFHSSPIYQEFLQGKREEMQGAEVARLHREDGGHVVERTLHRAVDSERRDRAAAEHDVRRMAVRIGGDAAAERGRELLRQRLEGPLLSNHRHAPRFVRRPLEQDALGELWLRERSQVRKLHGARRL